MYWVLVQILLLTFHFVVPLPQQFTTDDLLKFTAYEIIIFGLFIGFRSIFDLRKSLSVSPEPISKGVLISQGLYSYVRHPMYVSVLLLALGFGILSGSFIKLGFVIVLFGFFWKKSQYEEALLQKKYPKYKSYSNRVPAFMPKMKSFSMLKNPEPAIKLTLGFSFLFFVIFLMMVSTGQRGGMEYLSNLRLAIPFTTSWALGLISGALAGVKIAADKKLTVLTIVASLYGLLIALFIIGEIFFPH